MALNYLAATASELRELLDDGQITSEDLVRSYLERVGKDNISGAGIRALIEVASKESLLEQARSCDKQRRDRSVDSPLYGLPIVLKDNIATKNDLRTGSGSLAIRDATVPADATLVAKLRDAGMIILAKSNLSEWCNYRACGVLPNAWSGAGGQGLLPYNFDYDPSGSSSGSAAALAAGFAPLAIGTETDGSLICPSSRAALFALKPTVGLVSRTGIVPLSVTQDSPGPMAKSVRDIALLLNVIVGGDDKDEASVRTAAEREQDYTKFLQDSFDGLKFGILSPEHFLSEHELPEGKGKKIRGIIDSAVGKMKAAGAVVIDSVELQTLQDMLNFDPGSVQNYEFKFGLQDYLSSLHDTDIRTLSDVIKFNVEHPELESPQGSEEAAQETFIECDKCTQEDKESHDAALAKQFAISRSNGIDAVMQKHGVDVLVVPSEASNATRLAAMAGYPIATVPVGLDDEGVPFGLCFFSGRLREGTLIQAMSAFEKLFPRVHHPSFFEKDACMPLIWRGHQGVV